MGWATSSTATSGTTGTYTPTGNVTLYAIWAEGVPVPVLFPAINNVQCMATTTIGGEYNHSASQSTSYSGYGQYTTCKINGVTVQNTLLSTTIYSTYDEVKKVTISYEATFINGVLTCRTVYSKVTNTNSTVYANANSYPATAVFSGVAEYNVTFIEAPIGTEEVIYELALPDGTGGQISTYPGDGDEGETVPYGTVITATVRCATGIALNETYGPWTITANTTIPTPSLKFNVAPEYVNSSSGTTDISVSFRNITGVTAYIDWEIVNVYSSHAGNIAPGEIGFATRAGLNSGTTYTVKAWFSHASIATDTSKVTTTRITTQSSSST